MGHHHHHHGHHHHHHHHLKPTVIPKPAVRLHRHNAAAAPRETTPLVGNSDNHEKITDKCCLITTICAFTIQTIILLLVMTAKNPTPEISLESLSVSNLDIADDRISANWVIGLGLHNPAGDTAKYTDISYSMIYCGDPSGQPIIDAHKEYDDLILPPNNRTEVYLKDAVENLGFNKMALSYMIMDVADDGILEFDLVAKVAVVTGEDTSRFVLSCEGIEVSISSSHDGAGHATYTPDDNHCDLAKVN